MQKGTGKAAGSTRPDSAAKPRPHSAKPATSFSGTGGTPSVNALRGTLNNTIQE